MLRRIGLSLLAALIALVGAAFLLLAFYRWLDGMFPPTLAAAIVGGALIVIALATLLLTRRRKVADFGPEDLALAVLGFTSRAARSHPEKALVAAVLAGVLEEWLDTKPKASTDSRVPPEQK